MQQCSVSTLLSVVLPSVAITALGSISVVKLSSWSYTLLHAGGYQ